MDRSASQRGWLESHRRAPVPFRREVSFEPELWWAQSRVLPEGVKLDTNERILSVAVPFGEVKRLLTAAASACCKFIQTAAEATRCTVVENFWRVRNKHLAAESRGGSEKLPQRAGHVFCSGRETRERSSRSRSDDDINRHRHDPVPS